MIRQRRGMLTRVSNAWHDRCEKPDLPKPESSIRPLKPQAAIDINGTYAVESGSLTECAVVEGSGSFEAKKPAPAP